jgi:hypothetical protein
VNYDLRAKFLRKFLPSLVEGSRASWCGGASGDEERKYVLGARAQSAIQRAAVLYKPRLATFLTPKREDHTLSAVRYPLFNTFAGSLHIRRMSPTFATLADAMPQ